MEAWAWLTVYLVGFALLQLVLYRYFRQGGSGGEPAGSPKNGGVGVDAGRRPWIDSGAEQVADRGTDAGQSGENLDSVHCTHCGAPNERDGVYTYCRQCARPLE
jgi:hypothetical protein